MDIKGIGEKVEREAAFVASLLGQMRKVIVGQDELVRSLVMGLLANGHVLLEGVPGLAKTLSVRVLARSIRSDFQRIQFTPDLGAGERGRGSHPRGALTWPTTLLPGS